MIPVFNDVSKITVTLVGLAITGMQPCAKIQLQNFQIHKFLL